MTATVSLDFTVAICTYNGENRIPLVLEALLGQTGTEGLTWEVIVVDNNSKDETAAVVKSFSQRWPQTSPLRYAFEPHQGASFARQHAIEVAHSSLVGFLDDDNVPLPNWVSAAHRFAQEYPQAGVYGSRIQGEFESPPPPHFERISAYLALTERGNEARIYDPKHKVLPPGAGMVVRRQAWLEQVPPVLSLGGHSGGREAGEDLEVVLYIQRAGWQVWYNPHMRLFHRIPSSRLERAYLIRLFRGIGLSRYRTRMLSFPRWQRPLATLFYGGNDVYRILRHLIKYRQAVFTDIVTACEMTLYLYSLISPFYIWQRLLRQAWQQPIGK